MVVRENPAFTKDYFDPEKRYIGNSVQVFYRDGTSTGKVSIDYPIGHRRRRAEGIPVLLAKFADALAGHLPARQVERVLAASRDPDRLDRTPIHRFVDLFAIR
jgi:2-methylcitrate dehydratase